MLLGDNTGDVTVTLRLISSAVLECEFKFTYKHIHG
jgi:hypothetical protein